jgi:hypothetical protein
MSVQKRKGCGSPGNRDGFAYIEMMVALIIVSLVGGIIWQGMVNTDTLLHKIVFHSSTTVRLMQMEKSIRRFIGKVRYPFWVNDLGIEEGEDEIKIPFYEGESDRFLIVKYYDEQLIIEIQQGKTDELKQTEYFGPLSDVTIELAKNEDKEIIGVDFLMYTENKLSDPVKITARFGSNPFWAAITS